MLCHIMLYHIMWYHIRLYCILLCCTVLYCVGLYSIVFYCIVLYCNVLYGHFRLRSVASSEKPPSRAEMQTQTMAPDNRGLLLKASSKSAIGFTFVSLDRADWKPAADTCTRRQGGKQGVIVRNRKHRKAALWASLN